MTNFAERLYHRNRDPLHLVLDEATPSPRNVPSRAGSACSARSKTWCGAAALAGSGSQ